MEKNTTIYKTNIQQLQDIKHYISCKLLFL